MGDVKAWPFGPGFLHALDDSITKTDFHPDSDNKKRITRI
jgi:hypothetical protein